MSRQQSYFPPNGTKYQWGPKGLDYSPWTCRIWEAGVAYPATVSAWVDLIDGEYLWSVDVCDWHYKRWAIDGRSKDALEACLQAERAGEAEKEKLWLPWMAEAIKANWVPRCP